MPLRPLPLLRRWRARPRRTSSCGQCPMENRHRSRCRGAGGNRAHGSGSSLGSGRMKGVKGTSKSLGDPCATCGTPLTAENAVWRSPPRHGLQSWCRPCRNARSLEYQRLHPEQRRTTDRRCREKLKDEVIRAYGGKCECCGEATPEFLAIDHRHGGGTQHRKTVSSPTALRRLVIRQGFPDTYRLLCHNCNQAIGWFGSCPHARAQSV